MELPAVRALVVRFEQTGESETRSGETTMSEPWKPKRDQVDWRTCPRNRDAVKCDKCGEIPREIRCVLTTQTSFMRGDDEVTFLCIPCALSRGIVPSNAVCRLLWDKMLPLERTAIAARLRQTSEKQPWMKTKLWWRWPWPWR